MNKDTPPARVNSFSAEALDDFQPKKTPKVAPNMEVIDKLAEETGFVSRQAKTTPSPAHVAAPVAVRRHRTGRNQQLNIKVTGATEARFYAIADVFPKLTLGEVFENALQALVEKENLKL